MTTIPKISELYADLIAAVEQEFSITIPTFGKYFLKVFCSVQAAKFKLLYLYLAEIQKNIAPDTADPVAKGGTLERWGLLKLNRGPQPATAAVYSASISGTVGAIIPAKTIFKSDDDSANPGKLFILDAEFELTADPDTISLRALEAGLDSQLSISDGLTATSPIVNVEREATVTAETTEPLSAETVEEYRQDVIDSFRTEPQGGAGTDYRLWAQDVQGVRTAYPYAKQGEDGEIDLYVEAEAEDSTDGFGTPSAAMLTDVEEAVELDPDTSKPIAERGRRPLGVFAVNVQAVTPVPIDIDISGFVGITAAQQTAISNALDAMIEDVRPFIAGVDPESDENDILDNNKIIYTILSAVPGGIFTSVSFEVSGSYETSYEFTDGEIPYLNSISYV